MWIIPGNYWPKPAMHSPICLWGFHQLSKTTFLGWKMKTCRAWTFPQLMMMTQNRRNKHHMIHISAWEQFLLEHIKNMLLLMERNYKDTYFPSIFNSRPSMKDFILIKAWGRLHYQNYQYLVLRNPLFGDIHGTKELLLVIKIARTNIYRQWLSTKEI